MIIQEMTIDKFAGKTLRAIDLTNRFSVLCDGDACVVFGSRREAKSYVAQNAKIGEKK